MSRAEVLKELTSKVGSEIYVSDWYQIDQARIDAFASATDDHQWIHTDPDRAAKASPFGATIAHGYLTLSLYTRLRGFVEADKPPYPGVTTVINYGLNRARFPAPVRVGSRIRARSELLSVEETKDALQVIEKVTVEIEGGAKPAYVGEVIMRLYF